MSFHRTILIVLYTRFTTSRWTKAVITRSHNTSFNSRCETILSMLLCQVLEVDVQVGGRSTLTILVDPPIRHKHRLSCGTCGWNSHRCKRNYQYKPWSKIDDLPHLARVGPKVNQLLCLSRPSPSWHIKLFYPCMTVNRDIPALNSLKANMATDFIQWRK